VWGGQKPCIKAQTWLFFDITYQLQYGDTPFFNILLSLEFPCGSTGPCVLSLKEIFGTKFCYDAKI
jgi:hypothetical protein